MVMVDAGHEDRLLYLNGKMIHEREMATGQPVPPAQSSNTIRVDQIPANIRQLEAAAAVLGFSGETVARDWRMARSWLMREMKTPRHAAR